MKHSIRLISLLVLATGCPSQPDEPAAPTIPKAQTPTSEPDKPDAGRSTPERFFDAGTPIQDASRDASLPDAFDLDPESEFGSEELPNIPPADQVG